MSDKAIAMIVIGVIGNVFILLTFYGIVYPSVKEQRLKRKQNSCRHIWDVMDVDFDYSSPIYHFHCEYCNAKKEVREVDMKKFEEISQWLWYDSNKSSKKVE